MFLGVLPVLVGGVFFSSSAWAQDAEPDAVSQVESVEVEAAVEPAPKQPENAESEVRFKHENGIALHAEALGMELDGQSLEALVLLRRAVELEPKSELIAFDLGRIAFDIGEYGDVDVFLNRPVEQSASHLLKAYIHSERRNRPLAEKEVLKALEVNPNNQDALVFAKKLGVEQKALASSSKNTAKPGAKKRVRASVGTGIEFDSNVGVSPEFQLGDLNQGTAGLRVPVRGSVVGILLDKPVKLSLGGMLSYAPHVFNRSQGVGAFDVGAIAAVFALEAPVGPLKLGWTLTGIEVVRGNFIQFLLQGSTRLTLGWSNEKLSIKGYGGMGYRDFCNGTEAADYVQRCQPVPGQSIDQAGLSARDGFRFDAGVSGKVRFRSDLGLDFQAGVQGELAIDKRFAELGPDVGLYLRYAPKFMSLKVGGRYAYRDYGFDGATTRQDHLIGAGVDLRVPLGKVIGITADYLFVVNSSNGPFTYQRHIAGLGVDAKW